MHCAARSSSRPRSTASSTHCHLVQTGTTADPEIRSAASRLVDRLTADPSTAMAEVLTLAEAVLTGDSAGEDGLGEIALRHRIEEFPADG